MNAKPRSRWFRFSLRTLFIVVTLLCCWLGWQTSVVRQRRAVLADLKAKQAFQITPAQEWAKRLSPGSYPPGMSPPSTARVPLVRAWLGDEAIQEIWYTGWVQGFDQSDLDRVKKIFPEAELREIHPEPCHPGCFPRGTLVETPSGRRAIQDIQAGDSITVFLPGRDATSAPVQSVFVTENRLWRVETDEGELITTETQPLCLSIGETIAAGKLQPGDQILQRNDKDIRLVKVLVVSPTGRTEKVFNLIVGECEVFVAGGFLARSKPPETLAAR